MNVLSCPNFLKEDCSLYGLYETEESNVERSTAGISGILRIMKLDFHYDSYVCRGNRVSGALCTSTFSVIKQLAVCRMENAGNQIGASCKICKFGYRNIYSGAPYDNKGRGDGVAEALENQPQWWVSLELPKFLLFELFFCDILLYLLKYSEKKCVRLTSDLNF